MSKGLTESTATREAVKARAIKVYTHLIRGLRPQEIGQLEKLPHSTVYWLIQEGGRLLGGDLTRLAKSGILREMFIKSQYRERNFWTIHATATKPKEKLQALEQLREEALFQLNLAERLHLVDEKADLSKAVNTLSDLIALASSNGHASPTDHAGLLPASRS